jgi:hypothetical protein
MTLVRSSGNLKRGSINKLGIRMGNGDRGSSVGLKSIRRSICKEKKGNIYD